MSKYRFHYWNPQGAAVVDVMLTIPGWRGDSFGVQVYICHESELGAEIQKAIERETVRAGLHLHLPEEVTLPGGGL